MSAQVLVSPPHSPLDGISMSMLWRPYHEYEPRPLSPPPAPPAPARNLDAILAVAEESRLRRIRNSVVPRIHTLPPEILQHVFLLSLSHSATPSTPTSPTSTTYYAELRALRLVASYWCDLVESYALLWTRIDEAASETEVQLALRCSKTLPLHLSVGSTRHFGALEKCRERWASLAVWSTEREVVRAWTGTGRDDHSNLTSMKVLGPTLPSGYDLSLYHDATTDPWAPLTAPNLRELEVKGWSSSKWYSPALMSGLKRLVLSSGYRVWPAEWTLVQILRACPEMEVLELSTIEVTVGELEEGEGKVLLPNLERLTMRAVTGAAEQLLPLISFPTTTKVSIGRVLYHPHLQPFIDVMTEWIPSHLPLGSVDEVIMATREQLHDSELNITLGRHLAFELTDYVGGDYVRQTAVCILRKLESSTVKRATVAVGGEFDCLDVLDQVFPDVEDLVVDGPGSLVTLRTLNRRTGTGRYLVPKMAKMTLGHCAPAIGNDMADQIIRIIENRTETEDPLVPEIQLVVLSGFGQVQS